MPPKQKSNKRTAPTLPPAQVGPENGKVLDLGRSRQQIRETVLKYLEKSAGNLVYVSDIATDMGANRGSVQAAINQLQKNLPQIVTVVAGKAWRWDASAAAKEGGRTKRMYEELTVTKAGVILVQDEDGNVFKLEDL